MNSRAHRPRTARLLVLAAGAAALVGTSACASGGEEETRDAEVAAQAREAAREDRHRSPVLVVIEAAREDGFLSAEQELELDGLAEGLATDRESFRALHEELRASAVSAVRAGSANSEDFDQAVADGLEAVEERVQQGLDALVQVHDVLEPDQRAAVAESLRARLDERFGARPDPVRRERDGLQRFASYLVLSPTQVSELQALHKEFIGEKQQVRPSREELYGMVDAFEGDDFGAELEGLYAKKGRVLRARVARASERADSVLGVFTPQQRDLLADLILEGPSKLLLGDAAEPDAQ